jgi:hypothetical protein
MSWRRGWGEEGERRKAKGERLRRKKKEKRRKKTLEIDRYV